jgi:hypothetical protein
MIIELGKCFANYKLSEETVNLLNGLSITYKNKIVGLLNGFHNEIKNKWLLICSTNLNEEILLVLTDYSKSFRSLIRLKNSN